MAKVSLQEFKNRSIDIHGNFYCYDKVRYNTISDKIEIICPEHGLFIQTASGHMRGYKCPKCSKRLIQYNKSKKYKDEWLQKAKEIHTDKYDYSIIEDMEGITSTSKLPIVCNIHGLYYQKAIHHTKYQCGCKKCTPKYTLGYAEIIKRCSSTHANEYDYSLAEVNQTSDIMTIRCHDHGIFNMPVIKHLSGHKCPKCKSLFGNITKQDKWLDYIGVPRTTNNREVYLKIDNINKGYITVDGYIPETNTIYEFWGDLWHGNPRIYKETDINPRNKKTMGELYQSTLLKIERIKNAGYNLIDIWEDEWNDMSS